MSSSLLVEARGGVVRLTLNRPERRNALSAELLGRLESELGRLALDRSARVVVLAGAGPVFCAGHDLSELAGLGAEEAEGLFRLCSRVMLAFRSLPQPAIARVHGLATAAGCQLVAACDLAVAARGAAFATPGVKIGLFCTTPMIPLVKAIAPRAALEMLLTGAPISAERAMGLGLVNRVVDPASLDGEVDALVEGLLALSPDVLALGKRAFYALEGLDEPEAYRRAAPIMAENLGLPDAHEGISAFLEKRPPRWGAERRP